ncbi:multiple epidermal growth factor-like domains protein 10 [Platysternon megacephalum]|uniref:Multiple epidermal growth factor-like domains protein 10 n=1 Tax=Platysternon megacephalum TaxID=55544 RepID=A0A4D9EVA2_9SAUR|nr:multiple epidermal growth factor-like domains protein 10 [Platysternon megacephalum]
MSVFPVLRALLRPRLAPPARALHSQPPENRVGPLETVIGLGAFFLAFMVPSGWILANMESYKKRD